MKARKERGHTIADMLPISKMGNVWVLPLQAWKGVYVVGKGTSTATASARKPFASPQRRTTEPFELIRNGEGFVLPN